MRRFPRPRLFALVLLALACIGLTAGPAAARSRIKDIVSFEGVRQNKLVGYGLVVGLNGTGDSLRNAPFTRQSLNAMLERLGVNTRDANMDTKNVAAVMVTAELPAFAAPGAQVDVSGFGARRRQEPPRRHPPRHAPDRRRRRDLRRRPRHRADGRYLRLRSFRIVGHPRRAHGRSHRRRVLLWSAR